MIPLLIVVVIILLATLFWIPYYKWRDLEVKSLKGPYSYPFIGLYAQFTNKERIFEKLQELHKTYGKSFKGYVFNDLNIFTTDENLIEFAMTNTKTINKGTAYMYLEKWLGTGLLTSGADKWRRRRKMITPAYHFKVLDEFVEMFDRNSSVMVQKLQKEVGKPQTDIFPFVNLCALDTICETAMGTSVNAQLTEESEFVNATKEMNRIVMARGFEFLKAFDLTYFFTQDYWIERKALKVLHGFTMELIKSRREELLKIQNKKASSKDENETVVEVKRKDNFMDLLLKSSINGEPLSDEDIREEVDTFTFEGHDTVSSGISFALYLISNHPDVQTYLLEEQKQIFGNAPQRCATLGDLQEMTYMEMVIKETLRLYPSVPIMTRRVNEDVTYKDWRLKSGSEITVFIHELHRNLVNFPDPTKFIPERFLPANQSSRHPYCYIPFSAGHRNCIGQKFAMLEMKSTIGKVLRNFEVLPLVPKHEPHIVLEAILRSDNGVLMKLENRKW